MKRIAVLLSAALLLALLLPACKAKEPEPEEAVFTGTVLEVHDTSLLVQPDEDTGARRSGDQFMVGLAKAPVQDEAGQPLTADDFWLYDRVEVRYSGGVMETYPCQIITTSVKRLAKEPLTMERLLELEQKGDELTWIDFAPYEARETGSGLYILVFEMADDYSVWVGGSPGETPMYIRLRQGDGDEFIEIRETSIRDFLDGKLPGQNGAARSDAPGEGESCVGATVGDYPMAVMVEGAVYIVGEPIPVEVDESAILGRTTSYTDGWPARDGETNFSREPGLPYAWVEDGIVLLYEHEWRRCNPAE